MNTTKQTSITTSKFNHVELLANQTIVCVKSIKGTSFVGVRNYTNLQGEISNQTFVVGISYANLLNNDLQKLTDFDINAVINEYPNDKLIVLKAYNEMLTSLIKRTSTDEAKAELRRLNDVTIKQSDAQKNAYDNVANGLRKKETILYVYGLRVRKTILVSIEYPKTNSATKTIIKRIITKKANLQGGNFRQYKLGNMENLKIKGFDLSNVK
jgi:hypothetical protein